MPKGTREHMKAYAERWYCRGSAKKIVMADCQHCMEHTCHSCGDFVEPFWHVYCQPCMRNYANRIYPQRAVEAD